MRYPAGRSRRIGMSWSLLQSLTRGFVFVLAASGWLIGLLLLLAAYVPTLQGQFERQLGNWLL